VPMATRCVESRDVLDVDYETTKQGDSRALYEKKLLEDEGQENDDVYDDYEQQHTYVFVEEHNSVIDHVSEEDKEKQRQWEEEQRAYEEHIMKSYQMADTPNQLTEEEIANQQELEDADRFYQQHLEARERRLREQNTAKYIMTEEEEEKEQREWEETDRAYQKHLKALRGRLKEPNTVGQWERQEENRALQGEYQMEQSVEEHNQEYKTGEEVEYSVKEHGEAQDISEGLRRKERQIDLMKRKISRRTDAFEEELRSKDQEISSLKEKLKATERHFLEESQLSHNVSQILQKTQLQTKEMQKNLEKRQSTHEKELLRKDQEIATLEEKLKLVKRQREEDQLVSKEELSLHMDGTIQKTRRQIDELTKNMKEKHEIYNVTLAQKNEEIKWLERKLVEAERQQDKINSSQKEELLAQKISQIVQDTQRQTKEMRESMEKRRAVYKRELSRRDNKITSLEEKVQNEEQRRDKELLALEQSMLVNSVTQIVNEVKKQQAHKVSKIGHEIQIQLDNMKQSIKESKKLREKELFEQEQNIAFIEKKYVQEINEVKHTLVETTDNLLKKLNDENTKLRAAIDSVQNWETVAVTWEISDFERSLTSDSTTVFESQNFSILNNHTMKLELHIMQTPKSKEERNHDVGFFFEHDKDCTFLTMEALKGSTITFTGTNGTLNHYCGTSCDFTYETHDCRFGWKRIANLNEILKSCVGAGGSIVIEAFLRTKKMKKCHVSERNQIALNVRTER